MSPNDFGFNSEFNLKASFIFTESDFYTTNLKTLLL